jgi:hypothetical protein
LNVWDFGGNDSTGNGTAAAPFKSIQKAVNTANSGDTIQVAGGVYTYNAAQDQTSQFFGFSSVVFIPNKSLTIIGGFDGGFTASNPGTTTTVIDAQGLRRGVVVTAITGMTAGLNLQNVTIQNGLATAISARNSTLAGGGGLLAELSSLSVTNVILTNNTAQGGNSASGQAGAGAGGGIGVFSALGTVSLNSIIFNTNIARGGQGPVGGFGQGGGLFTDLSSLTGVNLTFTSNQAVGGNSSNPQDAAAETADGFGGGANFESSTGGNFVIALSNVTATTNLAQGGNAAVSTAAPGGGFGGAIGAENLTFNLTSGILRGNKAQGGVGGSGSGKAARLGAGGGYFATNSSSLLQRVALTQNTAQGGSGDVQKGSPSGGGIGTVSTTPNGTKLTLRNDLLADNSIVFGSGTLETNGGAGAGLDLNGTSALLSQCTFANNFFGSGATFNLQGQAIAVRAGAALTMNNCIIANHSNSFPNGGAAALHVFPGASVTAGVNLFAANTNNTNQNGQPSAGGTFNITASTIITASSAGFISPGSPNFDYRLTPNSPAVHAAVNSDTTVDINNVTRTLPTDLGAFVLNSPNSTGIGSTPGGVIPPPPPPPPPGGGGNIPGSFAAGAFNPANGTFYLRNSNSSGAPDAGALQFGLPGWLPIAGNWFDPTRLQFTPGVFDPASGFFYLRTTNDPTNAGVVAIQFGLPGWRPVAGDWDGTGIVKIGIFDPSTATFYLRTTNNPTDPRVSSVQFGVPGWTPLAGDWNNTGRWSVGVFNPGSATFYLRNSTNPADGGLNSFQYGAPGWLPVAGKFNAQKWGIGVVDPSTETWYLRFSTSGGAPDVAPFAYGAPGWLPVTGNWNGSKPMAAHGMTELAATLAAIQKKEEDAAQGNVLDAALETF